MLPSAVLLGVLFAVDDLEYILIAVTRALALVAQLVIELALDVIPDVHFFGQVVGTVELVVLKSCLDLHGRLLPFKLAI